MELLRNGEFVFKGMKMVNRGIYKTIISFDNSNAEVACRSMKRKGFLTTLNA